VVGDLEELIPADTSYTEDAEPVDDTAVARSAAEALAAILADEAERRLAARARRAANDQLRQGGRASGLHRRLARGLRLWVRRRVRRSS
jgi:hypothetical protein